MNIILKYMFTACVVLCVAPSFAGTVTLFDSMGFEPPIYTLGAVDGQNGWLADVDPGGIAPTIVNTAGKVIGEQALKLSVNNTDGAASFAGVVIGDPIALGYRTVTISADIYRNAQPPYQNLWWWWNDDGSPTIGLQWLVDYSIYPLGIDGSNPPYADTVYGRYSNITTTWDFDANTATAWYDGNYVGARPITGITQLTAWFFWLSHEAGVNTGADTAYIDNFTITATKPESVISAMIKHGDGTPQNPICDYTGRTFTVKVVKDSSVVETKTGVLSTGSVLTVALETTGTVDICVKVDGALSKKVTGVDLTGSAVNLGDTPIIQPDMLNDDVIDDFELNDVNGGFGSPIPAGTNADYNCDGLYDDFDLNQINGGFGTTGDCIGL